MQGLLQNNQQRKWCPSGAANFWRRMAAEHPSSIKQNINSSHPATAERFLALEKATSEIAEKQKNSQPLTPELKHN